MHTEYLTEKHVLQQRQIHDPESPRQDSSLASLPVTTMLTSHRSCRFFELRTPLFPAEHVISNGIAVIRPRTSTASEWLLAFIEVIHCSDYWSSCWSRSFLKRRRLFVKLLFRRSGLLTSFIEASIVQANPSTATHTGNYQ